MCLRSSLNACRSSSLSEILVGPRPVGDRVDHPADQLLDAALALGRADLAAEIFRDDDVGRLLRPGPRDLDVALLEHHFAALVADDGRAQIPFDLVERIDAGFGEEPRERQTRRTVAGVFFGPRLLRIDEGRHQPVPLLSAISLTCACSLVGSAIFHDLYSVRMLSLEVSARRRIVLSAVLTARDRRRSEHRIACVMIGKPNMGLTTPVCQACKHYILCLSFRSLARCGHQITPLHSLSKPRIKQNQGGGRNRR